MKLKIFLKKNKTLNLTMTHCCEALESKLPNYFCTKQVITSTFFNNLMHTKKYSQKMINTMFDAFYLKK